MRFDAFVRRELKRPPVVSLSLSSLADPACLWIGERLKPFNSRNLLFREQSESEVGRAERGGWIDNDSVIQWRSLGGEDEEHEREAKKGGREARAALPSQDLATSRVDA